MSLWKPNKKVRALAGGALCAALLALVGLESASRPVAADATGYHQRVADAVEAIDYHIDDWLGRDEAMPPEAVELLRPNALFARQYENIETGERVSLVLVQTQDARDLAGHYPPICYPAHGWTQAGAQPLEMTAAGITMPVMRYDFTQRRFGRGLSRDTAMSIDNFLITPDGQIVRSMQQVHALAGDYSRRMFGAAQIQLVFYDEVDDERRHEIFETLVGAAGEAIQAIRDGEVNNGQ